ncbi:hypothetical protein DIPPA_01029 [Diplonema papillatum]|nr:hypothetical protein DIPPA_01029 [Diplonema papillatum]
MANAACVGMVRPSFRRSSYRNQVKRVSEMFEATEADVSRSLTRPQHRPAGISEEERLQQWKLLGPVLKIQRWYRRCKSKASVKVLLEGRRRQHVLIWQRSAAETVQRCWKAYLVRKATLRR